MTNAAISCNCCGTTLEVGPSTRFVTCRQCGSRLIVVRTGTATYTEAQGDPDGRRAADPVDTTIAAAGTSVTKTSEAGRAAPLRAGNALQDIGVARPGSNVAAILWVLRNIWRVPIFWFFLIGLLAAIVGGGGNSIAARRTAFVLSGPLLLLTGGWTVFWLGQFSVRGFKKARLMQGWVFAGVTVAVSIGLLIFGAFIVIMMNFAVFYRQ